MAERWTEYVVSALLGDEAIALVVVNHFTVPVGINTPLLASLRGRDLDEESNGQARGRPGQLR
jgi:hypothetical protein